VVVNKIWCEICTFSFICDWIIGDWERQGAMGRLIHSFVILCRCPIQKLKGP
jgi:hypothetical protein